MTELTDTVAGDQTMTEAVMAGVPARWFAGPRGPYPEATLHELVARQAAARPHATAVRQWSQRLSYADLARGAARVSADLRAAGVRPEWRVAVCVTRRPHLVTALLGVLAAGAAYVPIDPDQPVRRRDMIVEDASLAVAVVDKVGREALAGTGLTLVDVPEVEVDGPCEGPAAARAAAEPPEAEQTGVAWGGPAVWPDNAAYTLFTSGSTGRPKGVVVSHRSAVAFCSATGSTCGVGPDTQGIGFASLSFDVSVLDIFTVLLAGGTVCLIPEDDRSDPARLQTFLAEHAVTWGYLAPALLPLLDPAALPMLRCVIVGGEATRPEQVARWSAGGRAFLNWYGPTETTVSVTGSRLDGEWARPLPIGVPLPNHRCYVLDERLRPVPPGEPGELCVAGVGLARGYVGQPGPTAAAFVPDPYATEPGVRMYRTGDRVSWRPDGTIAFLGRLDGQVKVRGQRVEVGEVEAAVAGHPAVAQAAVELRRGPSGDGELVCYVTPASAPDPGALRAYLVTRLPAAMVPGRFAYLDALPLTLSSKVDFAALRALADATAAPGAGATAAETAAAETAAAWAGDVERGVARAWSRVLGTPPSGPDDDFTSAGGTSLHAMRLAAAVRGEVGRDVGVADVFRAGTLGALAAYAATAPQLAETTPPAGPVRALSPAQRRLWFIDRLTGHTPAYHIAVADRLRGRLDVDALAGALADVADRQEVLRWRLPDRDGVPFVAVAPPGQAVLAGVEDLSGAGDVEAELRRCLDEEARRPMDLAAGPLWRVRLFRLGADDHVLALTMHHVVFDAWSLRVLRRDLDTAYAARLAGRSAELAPPALEFGAYAARLAARERGAEVAWWLDRLAGAPTDLELPTDRARPPVAAHRGAAARTVLAPELTAAVRRIARELRVTPHAATLAAFAVLLRRLTGATDLIVGVPVADRRDAALDDVVAFLVDTVPIRLGIDDAASFATHVHVAHAAVVEALGRDGAPFEKLVEGLRVPRDLSRNPLVQVLFNSYELTGAAPRLSGLDATELPAGLPGALFDLTLYVIERGPDIDVEAVYDPDLFDAGRIEALLASYATLLGAFTADPGAPIGSANARPCDPKPALPDLHEPTAPVDEPAALGDLIAAAWAPDRVALTGAGGTLTYADFAALAGTVRDGLHGWDVGAGDTVAVIAARDTRLPAVLLGVLNSGARWLVVEPDLPPARSAGQLAAVGVRLAILLPGTHAEPGWPPLPTVTLDELTAATGSAAASAHEPAAGLKPVADCRGYLMATSGTTGEPLIVGAPEAPLARFLHWYAARLAIGPDDATALVGGLAHDPLLRDAFAPLVAGGRVCVPAAPLLRDPVPLGRFLADHRVTVLHLTPSLGRMLATAGVVLPDVRLAVFAGERLSGADVAAAGRWLPRAALINGYGATETPQLQAVHAIDTASDAARADVPVGRGVGGTELHVLRIGSDGRPDPGRPAAVGELGEVAIRGRSLADGYTDPGPTVARFADNGEVSDRMFHTGDLGRYDADGRVVLAGRRDGQVKIRGHRVELGEVAAALAAHPDVAQAAATVHTIGGEPRLVAYAVPTRAGVPAAALRDFAAAALPEHARPADVVLLAAMPLTRNGKLDRDALPPPTSRPTVVTHTEPATPTERTVAATWCQVLSLPRVSVTANFFDIGGHSLAVVAVQARIRAALDRHVEVVDLFRFPTVRDLAGHLDGGLRAAGLDRADRRIAAQRDRRARAHRPIRPTSTGPTTT